MSKLNRREFKELLTEWQSNFINERGNPTLNKFIEKSGADILPAYLFFVKPLNAMEKAKFHKEIKSKLSSETNSSVLFYCLDKSIENVESILKLLDNSDKDLLRKAVYEDLPIFITNESGNFNTYEKGSKDNNIAWAIHDLFHGFEHQTNTFSKLSGLDAKSAFSSPDNDIQWSLDIEGINPDTGVTTDESLMSSLEDSLSSVREYFDSIDYAKETGYGDEYPTIWAYVCTHINSESDIDSLPLDDHAKKMFKFYLDRKNLFIEILKSPGVKSKIFIMFWGS